MKKLLFAGAFALVVLNSCKKEYHCSCEVVSSQGYKYTAETHSFRETKKGAVEACNGQEQSTELSGQSSSCVVVAD